MGGGGRKGERESKVTETQLDFLYSERKGAEGTDCLTSFCTVRFRVSLVWSVKRSSLILHFSRS